MEFVTRDEIRRACLAIADLDPDGWEDRRPAHGDHLMFAEWVHDTYGAEIYRVYFRTDWDSRAVV